jgi:hypothetical protein
LIISIISIISAPRIGTEYSAWATCTWWSGCTFALSTQKSTSNSVAGAGSIAARSSASYNSPWFGRL